MLIVGYGMNCTGIKTPVLLEDARVCATLNQMAIGNSDAYLSGLIGTFGTET